MMRTGISTPKRQVQATHKGGSAVHHYYFVVVRPQQAPVPYYMNVRAQALQYML